MQPCRTKTKREEDRAGGKVTPPDIPIPISIHGGERREWKMLHFIPVVWNLGSSFRVFLDLVLMKMRHCFSRGGEASFIMERIQRSPGVYI